MSSMTITERLDRIGRGEHLDLADIVCRDAKAEIERLNKWADGFSDAQLKERRLCEDRIKEMQRQIDTYGLALLMIREGVAEPAKFAGETLEKYAAPR